MHNKPHTKEAKIKISLSQKGKPGHNKGRHWKINPKYLPLMSQRMIGNTRAKGVKHTKETKRKWSEMRKGKRPYIATEATREKMSKSRKGKRTGSEHPGWKGGISKDVHSVNEPKYRGWRLKVFSRDSFKCRLSNNDCDGTIQAHHILKWADYPKLRYNVNNGITLCLVHHPRRWAEEKRLIPLFQVLVSVSKEKHIKLQNTTDIRFKFEGTIIEPGQIQEVKDEVGQRLLALWWHHGLELVEEKAPETTFPPIQEVMEQAKEIEEKKDIEVEKVVEPIKEETFPCDKCTSVFKSKRALDAHKKFSKNCK
jgi:hypothetical protein